MIEHFAERIRIGKRMTHEPGEIVIAVCNRSRSDMAHLRLPPKLIPEMNAVGLLQLAKMGSLAGQQPRKRRVEALERLEPDRSGRVPAKRSMIWARIDGSCHAPPRLIHRTWGGSLYIGK